MKPCLDHRYFPLRLAILPNSGGSSRQQSSGTERITCSGGVLPSDLSLQTNVKYGVYLKNIAETMAPSGNVSTQDPDQAKLPSDAPIGLYNQSGAIIMVFTTACC